MNAPTAGHGYGLSEFMADYPDDAACLDYLWRRHLSRDGETARCPKCEAVRRFHKVSARRAYSCGTCGHHLHPTKGTIFEKSSTSLHLWFQAIFLITASNGAVSAKQLQRELGVTYKTAWRMSRLIDGQLRYDLRAPSVM